MGHAHHFLSRLDRLTDAQHLENAKLLYNDSGLLNRVLKHAAVPTKGERVAISLEHPVHGPWVITTRDGRFVTCLGAGMKPSKELPRVPPDIFKSVVATDAQLRGYFDALCQYTSRSGAPVETALVGWALKRPERIALEDARALAGLSLVATRQVAEVVSSLEGRINQALLEFSLCKRKAARCDELGRTIRNLLAGEAHLITSLLASFGIGQAERVSHIPPAWGVWLRYGFAFASVGSAARVIWALRSGPSWLDTVHAQLETCPDESLARLLHIAGVAGILGSPWSSKERLERLSTLLGSAPSVFRVDELREAARTAILQPAASVARAVRAGRALYQERSEALPFGHPHRYSAPGQVPQGTALATIYSVTPRESDDVLDDAGVLVVAAMPHFLNADFEDLYLPRAVVDALTGRSHSGSDNKTERR
jgi:hypothetical protein